MTSLEQLSLLDLLPSSMLGDEDIEALVKALDPELQAITKRIIDVIMIPRIDEMPEDIIDSLAWQFHVDFYEPLGMNLNKKRELVKNSLIWHRYRGTKYVLEEMIRILYTENFLIREWFEYDGDPYYFRIVIDEDAKLTESDFNYIVRAVMELKNVRSWLEGIFITKNYKAYICVWGWVELSRQITIRPTTQNRESTDHLFIGSKPAVGQNIYVGSSEYGNAPIYRSGLYHGSKLAAYRLIEIPETEDLING